MLGIFLDSETNGLNPFVHRVIEIALKLIDLQTQKVVASYETLVYVEKEAWDLSDKTSLHINGLTYAEVSQGKKKELVSQDIQALFKENNIQRGSSFFICQNPSFDRMFFAQLINPEKQESLNWPYHWLDLASMYWAVSMRKGQKDPKCYPWVTGISKNKIADVYYLPPEQMPHRAMNGVDHLISCYQAVLADSF